MEGTARLTCNLLPPLSLNLDLLLYLAFPSRSAPASSNEATHFNAFSVLRVGPSCKSSHVPCNAQLHGSVLRAVPLVSSITQSTPKVPNSNQRSMTRPSPVIRHLPLSPIIVFALRSADPTSCSVGGTTTSLRSCNGVGRCPSWPAKPIAQSLSLHHRD